VVSDCWLVVEWSDTTGKSAVAFTVEKTPVLGHFWPKSPEFLDSERNFTRPP